MITDSFDLFMRLKALDLLGDSPRFWWPNAHTFEVVVGALLTQNTKWESVEKSLANLKSRYILTLDNDESLQNLANSTPEMLMACIRASGFYAQKSHRLLALAQHILEDFGDFASFVVGVEREWLLAQKGIGLESADAILNYACRREVMVVDKYTHRLVANLGFEFEDYEGLQEWCMRGVGENLHLLEGYEGLDEVFARFHGKIVEFSKRKLSLS